ncbi:MAG: GTP 3',8-cyclase MoaA [Clostridia bacterium]|nr:GTP 3',8-cyclase MoaA [Clostridia bacterium]
MTDGLGRSIDYLRVSLTDRCNLRCRYCMPNGAAQVDHADVLRYEELLRLCRLAADLGVTKFKVTGGEPLVRRDCAAFLAELKGLAGVEQVTLTTNGVLLASNLDALKRAGVDGVNVSLDTLDDALYSHITGAESGTAGAVWEAVRTAAALGIPTKLNAVLLPETAEGLTGLVEAADALPIDVRFIELMPIGAGAGRPILPADAALSRLRGRWPELAPTGEVRGNGPARYYACSALRARVGIIAAVSHGFCGSCNRVRLTATGELKPCLCYGGGTDLRALLRAGAADAALRAAMVGCIQTKPASHRFGEAGAVTEGRGMNEIGG